MTGRSRRIALAVVATLALTALSIGTAAAAVPGNDGAGTPTNIASLPFSDALVTTDATSESVDPTDCVTNGHTVWYQFTATTTQDLLLDTFGSDFDTVVHVGTPNGLGGMTVIGCNDDAGGTVQSAVRFTATAGTTYLIAIGSFADSAGGNLDVHLDVAPPPLVINVTIDSGGSFNGYGIATIHGSVTCSQPILFAKSFADLSQRVGRITIRGFGDLGLDSCGPAPSQWTSQVSSPDGRFAGGKASANVFIDACGVIDCTGASASRVVQLRH